MVTNFSPNQMTNQQMVQMMPMTQYAQANRNVPATSAAVNIQIIEPKNYSSPAPVQNPIYNYPQANYYPQMQQQTQSPDMMPMPQQMPYMMPQMPPVQQVALPQQQATPVPPQPVIETVPASQPQVAQVQPAAQTVAQATAPAVASEVKPAPATPPAIDVAGINTKLASTNLDEQTAAIQKIAEVGQSDPAVMKALLNEETLKGLTDIVSKDTTALTGADKEKAEVNKQYGTYTLAVWQKNFRNEIDKEAAAQGLPPIAINDVPGIANIMENLKSSTNPVIREASISALGYIAKPEDKTLLTPVLELVSKEDADDNVKNAAQTLLNKVATA